MEGMLEENQAARMDAIRNSGVKAIDTSAIRNDIAKDIAETFNIKGIVTDADGKPTAVPIPGREPLIDLSNQRDIQAIQMLERVSKTKTPLEMMDTIKNLQKLIYDRSTPFSVSKDMKNLVKRSTGKLNENMKRQLPPEYGDIVAQMADEIRTRNELDRVFKA